MINDPLCNTILRKEYYNKNPHQFELSVRYIYGLIVRKAELFLRDVINFYKSGTAQNLHWRNICEKARLNKEKGFGFPKGRIYTLNEGNGEKILPVDDYFLKVIEKCKS